ncbi:hypothetical protein MFLAVUS_009727 [Mucor flavus]|uniref:GRIP domain-containing protein n=1 Tax=Mucor flavus TaxID=439312 RepID=A0ABP9ZAT6_9FUNG
MVKQQLSNNKKVLQDQVVRLNNEIEELQLEREESKKNVLHFMQEADGTRQELIKAHALLDELSSCQMGYHSPPLEQDVQKPKISGLLSKLSDLDETKLLRLFLLLEEPDLKDQLDETIQSLLTQTNENLLLKDELDQIKQEYQATRAALKVENERAEIIEKRWKESESSLEQTESTIQSLNKELDQFRQQEWKATSDNNLSDILCTLENKHRQVVEQLGTIHTSLEEKEKEVLAWQEKYQVLHVAHTQMENKQTELDASKMRENHLRTINKTLRDEVRKVNKVQEETVNIEYLRNVMIKFLEKRNTRAQLVPILSTLLQCSSDEKLRLRIKREKFILPSLSNRVKQDNEFKSADPECNFEGDIPESETNIKEENDESKEFFKGLLFSVTKIDLSSLETSAQDESSSEETSENESSATTETPPRN